MIIFWRVDKMHNPEFWSIPTPRDQEEEKEPLKDTEKEWGTKRNRIEIEICLVMEAKERKNFKREIVIDYVICY